MTSIKKFITQLNLRAQNIWLRYFVARGIGTAHITNGRLLLGIFAVACYVFWSYYTLSYKLLFIAILLGFLNNYAAGFEDDYDDRSRFLDLFVDYILYSFLLLLVNVVAGSYKLVAYNLFIIPILYLLAVIKKQESQPSSWIIKPSAKMWYVKALVYIAFFSHWFIANDTRFIYRSLVFSNYLATFLAFYYFLYIQLRWKKYKRR